MLSSAGGLNFLSCHSPLFLSPLRISSIQPATVQKLIRRINIGEQFTFGSICGHNAEVGKQAATVACRVVFTDSKS